VTLLACLASPPGDCTGRPLELPDVRNETACILAGRLALHEWRRAHPEMRVLDARCERRPLRAVAAQDGGA
jgi:hypothetical protein